MEQSKTTATKVCNFFYHPSGCSFGEQCRFKHVQTCPDGMNCLRRPKCWWPHVAEDQLVPCATKDCLRKTTSDRSLCKPCYSKRFIPSQQNSPDAHPETKMMKKCEGQDCTARSTRRYCKTCFEKRRGESVKSDCITTKPQPNPGTFTSADFPALTRGCTDQSQTQSGMVDMCERVTEMIKVKDTMDDEVVTGTPNVDSEEYAETCDFSQVMSQQHQPVPPIFHNHIPSFVYPPIPPVPPVPYNPQFCFMIYPDQLEENETYEYNLGNGRRLVMYVEEYF